MPGNVAVAVADNPIPEFAPYTFPRYRCHLDAPPAGVVLVTARLGDRPVGLAMLERQAAGDEMRLLSLAVDREHRRRGIGTNLLLYCATLAIRGSARALLCLYSNKSAEISAFEAALARAGWLAPELLELRVSMRCGDTRHAMAQWPGMRRLLTGSTYRFFPWRDMTSDHARTVARLSREPACRMSLRPFPWEDRIDPDVSVLVLQAGELIGWVVIVVADGEQGLFCPAAYIRQSSWRSGALVGGYFHVFERVTKKYGPNASLRFSTAPSLPGMMALTRKRFVPIAQSADEWRRAEIAFPAETSARGAPRAAGGCAIMRAGPPREIIAESVEFGIYQDPLLTITECNSVFDRVLSLQDHWLRRDTGVKFYTLGAAIYLDAAPQLSSYLDVAKIHNPIIKERFGDVLDYLVRSLATRLDANVIFESDLALPGFHIFDLLEETARSVDITCRAHFDRQEGVLFGPLPPEKTLSFTLSINETDTTLAVWPLRRTDPDAFGLPLSDYASSHPHQLVRYRRGSLLTHDGSYLHAIGPIDVEQSQRYRITLQGHGVKLGGIWVLYW